MASTFCHVPGCNNRTVDSRQHLKQNPLYCVTHQVVYTRDELPGEPPVPQTPPSVIAEERAKVVAALTNSLCEPRAKTDALLGVVLAKLDKSYQLHEKLADVLEALAKRLNEGPPTTKASDEDRVQVPLDIDSDLLERLHEHVAKHHPRGPNVNTVLNNLIEDYLR